MHKYTTRTRRRGIYILPRLSMGHVCLLYILILTPTQPVVVMESWLAAVVWILAWRLAWRPKVRVPAMAMAGEEGE